MATCTVEVVGQHEEQRTTRLLAILNDLGLVSKAEVQPPPLRASRAQRTQHHARLASPRPPSPFSRAATVGLLATHTNSRHCARPRSRTLGRSTLTTTGGQSRWDLRGHRGNKERLRSRRGIDQGRHVDRSRGGARQHVLPRPADGDRGLHGQGAQGAAPRVRVAVARGRCCVERSRGGVHAMPRANAPDPRH